MHVKYLDTHVVLWYLKTKAFLIKPITSNIIKGRKQDVTIRYQM